MLGDEGGRRHEEGFVESGVALLFIWLNDKGNRSTEKLLRTRDNL